MLAFVVRRILASIPILLGATFLVHVCLVFAGNPLSDLRLRNPRPSEATLQNLSHKLHYDQNFFHRYLTWLGGLLHGDFGPSTRQLDIGSEIHRRLFVTLTMVVGAMVLAVVLAVIAGVLGAQRRGGVTDNALTFSGFLFLAMPAFWFAALLKTLAIESNRHLHTSFKTLGDSTPNLSGGWWAHFQDRAEHLVLPTISLALISYAAWSRFQRASMIEVMDSDYIRLARAKGLSARRVTVRHALRNALIPLTTVVAIDIGAILGGAVITEHVFAWHGMGELFIDAVNARDVNVVLAWLLVSGMFVIVFNLIADLLYAVLDPRIRHA